MAAAQQQQQGAAAFGGGPGGNLLGGAQPFGDPSRPFLGYGQYQGGGGAYSLLPAGGSSKATPPSSSYFSSSTKGNSNNVFDAATGVPHSSSTTGRLVSRERSTSAPNVCIHNTNILFSDSPNSALYPPSSGGSLGYGSASRRFDLFCSRRVLIIEFRQIVDDKWCIVSIDKTITMMTS